MKRLLVILGVAFTLSAGAAAEEAQPAPPAIGGTSGGGQTTAGRDYSSCSCRYPGGSAELGETVCMNSSGQPYLARCEMVLNNTAWKRVKEGCPPPDVVSSLSLRDRLFKLADPGFDPGLVYAEIARPVD